jgi:hypothetical protein
MDSEGSPSRHTLKWQITLDAGGMTTGQAISPNRSSHIQYGSRSPVCLSGSCGKVSHGDGIRW